MSNDSNHKECCCCYGPQGPQGIAGLQGMQGMQGMPGLNGQDGAAGPMGSQGPQGNQGTQGPKGDTGQIGQQGPLGPMGNQGPQGPSGSDGKNGANGSNGPQGPQGLTGPEGPQGIQGLPGKDCPEHENCCCKAWCNVYSSLAQTIGAYSNVNDTVLFDKNNEVVLSAFDLSLASSTGDVKFLKHGRYHITWQLQARIVPPVPVPVPSWSFGFWLNAVLVPGSIYSGYTQAPGDDACHSTGDVIIEVKAGDLLRLRNTSITAVNLNPNITGSVFPITIASVNIVCLEELA